MAIPTLPTADSIVTEALKRAGIKSPTQTQIDRAKDEWLEMVKGDIWSKVLAGGDTRLKSLQRTAVYIGVIGQRRYPLPADFSEEISVSLLSGTHTGLAQTGGSDSVTLAADEDITAADAAGTHVLMYSGTSKGQYRETITYDATTKVLTTPLAWDSSKTPAANDEYMIVDTYTKLAEQHQNDLDDSMQRGTSKPGYFSKFEDELYLGQSPVALYGIQLRYYVNITTLNLTEGANTVISKIYRNWRSLLTQGVYKYALLSLDDARDTQADKDFNKLLISTIFKELPSGGEFEGFEV